MSRPILLVGGRLLDPSQSLDESGDLLVRDGLIEEAGQGISAPDDAEQVDASGCVVAPGFIDLHVHLREPGDEHKETISSICTRLSTASPKNPSRSLFTKIGYLADM